MAGTDTSEKGLEILIVRDLVAGGYVLGDATDYNRDLALDVLQLLAFLRATQPKSSSPWNLDAEGIQAHAVPTPAARRNHQARRGRCAAEGREPRPGACGPLQTAADAGQRGGHGGLRRNIFSVTRQVRYSIDEAQRALDLAMFINGLPVMTFELKNSLTKQTIADAVVQYQTDRNPSELLFQLGRCVAHIAVDDAEVRFCTHLTGKISWFLPFNKGWNSGAGNPPNPNGLKTDYLWKQVLVEESLANIIENYAQIIEEEGRAAARRTKANFSSLPPAPVGARAAAVAASDGVGQALPDPAFGRQRQEQHHRLAGAPAGRTENRGRCD